jgi:hypothetical protein
MCKKNTCETLNMCLCVCVRESMHACMNAHVHSCVHTNSYTHRHMYIYAPEIIMELIALCIL